VHDVYPTMTSDSPSFDVVTQLGALRRYARSLTRNVHDAEDLVQESLTRAYEKRHALKNGASLRGWLFSILHNAFVSDRRAHQSSGALTDAFDEHTTALATNPAHDHVVRLRQLERAFDALPEDQRAALHLVTIEGLSYQDAASTLAVPIGTLMSRLGRARAALRAFEDGVPGTGASTASRTVHLKVVGGLDADR